MSNIIDSCPSRVRIRRAGAALLFPALLLSGCATSTSDGASTPSNGGTGDIVADCNNAPTAPVDGSTEQKSPKPTEILLLNHPSPDDLHQARAALVDAARAGATVIIASGDPAAGTTVFSLVGSGTNPTERRNTRCGTLGTALQALTSAGSSAGTDVFGALKASFDTADGQKEDAAAGGKQPPHDVLVFGSATSTTPVPFTSEALDQPSAVLIAASQQQLLRPCTAWRFGFFTPTARDSGWLGSGTRGLWRTYANKCGGKLVAWSSTYSRLGDTELPPPSSVQESSAPTRRTQGCATTYTLPAALFKLNSAELTPDATTALLGVRSAVSSARAISVDGYTDDTTLPGDPGFNARLSQQRSDSVASVVRSWAGPTPVVSTGHGAADPVAPNSDATRHLNRRVEITLRSGGSACS